MELIVFYYAVIIYVIVVILAIISIISIIFEIKQRKKHKQEASQINFHEFDDLDKIKQKDRQSEEQIEHEVDVLTQVAIDGLVNVNIDNEVDISVNRAFKEVEKAKKDLKNFKVIDSVEVKNQENIHEGVTINIMRENGETLNIELFKKWSREIFKCIKLREAEDLEAVKAFMTTEMYDKLTYQEQQFDKDKIDLITKDLLVKEVKLLDYKKDLKKQEIQIFIKARMKEYIIEKESEKVIRGNKHKSKVKRYIMTFEKRTDKTVEDFIENCPNCGAGVKNIEFERCGYCGNLLIPVRYNWTLVKLETI